MNKVLGIKPAGLQCRSFYQLGYTTILEFKFMKFDVKRSESLGSSFVQIGTFYFLLIAIFL